jgi:hypothetical protein
MQVNSEIIISDTSCLILLGKIDEIDLLHRLQIQRGPSGLSS